MATNGTDDQPVGYGQPPKQSQFPKGKSGNPKGRPKGSRNFSTLLHDELNTKIPITENGNRRKITKQEAMAKQLANKGAAGDLKAIPLVMNEIRLRESLPGSGQNEVVRAEDQMVIDSIVKRIRGAAEVPLATDTAPEPSTKPQQKPIQIDPSEDLK